MSKPPTLVFDDDYYDGQLARTMSAAVAGMADLGEAIATARQVGKPTPDHWHDAWRARADAVMAAADTARDPVTRRSALLRASEHYRQAFFFLRHDLDDDRLQDAYRRHVDAFTAAMPLLSGAADPFTVDVGGTSVKGYVFSPDRSGVARPTVLSPCGYDSTAEETFTDAPGILGRGWNLVAFEGPGQGATLYRDRVYMQPDFTPVLSAVVDHVVGRPDVDADRLVVFGRSFAGYLAPQAAAGEHRIAALVCDPAQPSMAAHLPEGFVGKVAPAVVSVQSRLSENKREFFGARMATHGISDVGDYFAELRRYDMLATAGAITCPTLLVECEGDFVGGGGATLQAAMTAPTRLVSLTAEQGAGGHCAGLGQRIWDGIVFDWLAETLPTP